jgi:N-acetylated-alpha-linked acidic dipeptidase
MGPLDILRLFREDQLLISISILVVCFCLFPFLALSAGLVTDDTDPTTPGYASKPGVERVTPSNLPKIPAVAISHRDAQPILKALDGHGSMLTGRSDWVGGLKANYSSGPAPGITLSLSNKMQEVTTPIWNVIGMINGTNANETVIIGNHRDAWIVGGAADPNSGSAILIEMTKAFGKLLETGWKPRRNMFVTSSPLICDKLTGHSVFASWDAEEYGLVGSTEWVEEHAPWLSETAIAYINVDIGVTGNYPGGGATPEFRNVAQDVMKKVVHGNRTLYDSWYQLYRFLPEDNGFLYLGAASDYAAFLQLGIGAVRYVSSTVYSHYLHLCNIP